MILSPALPSSSSRQPVSSKTKRLRSTSFGRPTLPTSRFWAGAGSISVRFSTITAATSSPGSSAPTCGLKDVTDTLDLALQASGCDQVHVVHKPRLLSDNGSSYVSGDLAEWLQDKGMKHSRGAPYHPQTQGKIERWHQTLKNRILLENYFLPGDLEAQIEAFVDHYNSPALSREHQQRHTRRRLLRP